jgi:hydroxymethylglutaryl-CoA reductase
MANSRLPEFYKRSLSKRIALIKQQSGLTESELNGLTGLENAGLTPGLADQLIENAIGVYGLPMGIATNFQINGSDVLIPMVIEEPSVIAAVSFSARLAREGGGFRTSSTEPEMIGQIQILDIPDMDAAETAIRAHREELLALASQHGQTIHKLGGGARALELRRLDHTAVGPMLIVHVIVDCRDAMGANMVNTICEALADPLSEISGGRVGLRILSNLADRRLARAECSIPIAVLAFEDYPGDQVAAGIVEAWAFADVDPYRATTHNKGVMNGVDAVVIATGNDWRAIEAGAHAYASRNGRYTSLTTWGIRDGHLIGALEMPMPVGIVGGTTQAHPAARIALKLIGARTARELAEIITAVGLAQNLAAIRALATEGIQKGHMALHARQLALAAGATPDQISGVVQQMLTEGTITLSHAEALVKGQPHD